MNGRKRKEEGYLRTLKGRKRNKREDIGKERENEKGDK